MGPQLNIGGVQALPKRYKVTPMDSPVCELSKHDVEFDLEVTDDVTGQVKVEMFDISGLVTSATKILMYDDSTITTQRAGAHCTCSGYAS